MFPPTRDIVPGPQLWGLDFFLFYRTSWSRKLVCTCALVRCENKYEIVAGIHWHHQTSMLKALIFHLRQGQKKQLCIKVLGQLRYENISGLLDCSTKCAAKIEPFLISRGSSSQVVATATCMESGARLYPPCPT